MRLAGMAVGLGLAWLASPAAAANIEDARAARTHIMWFPAGSIWTAGLPAQACGTQTIARDVLPTGDLALAPALRPATWERRGELVAEIRTPGALTLTTLNTARTCAASAADVATAPAMLTAAVEPWAIFQTSLATCLRTRGAGGSLGSITLWIDTSCNW